jgi:hypothetical protein
MIEINKENSKKMSELLGARDKRELEMKIENCASKLEIDEFLEKAEPLVS